MVVPEWEYNYPNWSSRYSGYSSSARKDKSESVRRRFTKRLKSFDRISYVAHQGWSCQKSDLTRPPMWCFVLFGVLLIWIAIAFSVSLIVSPFTRVVIILDCIRSNVMLAAV